MYPVEDPPVTNSLAMLGPEITAVRQV